MRNWKNFLLEQNDFELTSFTMDKYSKKNSYRFYIEEKNEYKTTKVIKNKK
jgi:hypothetical protein